MPRILFACFTLLLGSHALAASPYEDTTVQRGVVLSAGRVDPNKDVGTGWFLDANYTSVGLNGGIATKRFGDAPGVSRAAHKEQVTNAYFGVGFSRLIQFQYGYGTEGDLLRLRSDFNFRAVIDFLSNTKTPKHRYTLADRLTFTVSAERYNDSDKKYFHNATWGVGLLF